MKTKGVVARKISVGISTFIRIALGSLFLYSSLPKIRHPYDFLSDVYSYEIVGRQLGLLVAMVLPWAELLTGICLLGGIFVGGALLMSIGMAVMFTFVISWALYQGLNISCGCFGSGTEKITYLTLIRAIGILLASCLAYGITIWLGPSKSEPVSSQSITSGAQTA